MTGARIILRGKLHSASVVPWICHRARLLDLKGWVSRDSDCLITIALTGPDALVDAMEVACNLGPMDAMIETIDRKDYHFNAPPTQFEVA